MAAWCEAQGLWAVALACFAVAVVPGAPLSISPGHAFCETPLGQENDASASVGPAWDEAYLVRTSTVADGYR